MDTRKLCAAMATIAAVASLPAGSAAADRQIGVDPALATSYSQLTGGAPAPWTMARGSLAAGFWQRSSGAAPGVGSNNVANAEFQLPETPPTRIRSASYQFSGRQSQCAGDEPVVFAVYAYAADGRAHPADATAGTRIATLSANCRDNPAFNRPIDVTNIVRQLSVPSGVRFVGFSVRKGNNRRGPGYFFIHPGKLTIVVASEDVALAPAAGTVGTASGGAPAADGEQQFDANKAIAGLAGAAGTLLRGRGQKPARDQAKDEAAAALSHPTSTVAVSAPAAGSAPAAATEGAPLDVTASPAPAAAAVTPMAATSAPSAAAGSAARVDIVGIRLGMSLDEVKRALQAHSPTTNVDETRGIVNSVAATDYLSWVIARARQGAPAGSGDAIGVHFPPPPNAHRAIFVERFTGFQPNQYPLFETLKAALVQKFGQPSQETDVAMFWTYNANGVQIVDNGVAARCGKFAPIDPPARGQNVLFNGYKTAGCGVTVYARYERGRGPSDRDLVRWLSVSMVDDSRFEDMRQAAARFATQATRAGASRVAAPRL
jgi:hypothetical protein